MLVSLRQGGKLPGWYENAPTPHQHEDLYLAAFNALSTCRQFGSALGPIPWRDLVAYADRLGLEGPVADGFCYVLEQMDVEYLAWKKAEEDAQRRADERAERNRR